MIFKISGIINGTTPVISALVIFIFKINIKLIIPNIYITIVPIMKLIKYFRMLLCILLIKLIIILDTKKPIIYPPVGPAKILIPARYPENTGIPISPKTIYSKTVKVASCGNKSALNIKITNDVKVIGTAPIGTLIGPRIDRIAENTAIFVILLIFIFFTLIYYNIFVLKKLGLNKPSLFYSKASKITLPFSTFELSMRAERMASYEYL